MEKKKISYVLVAVLVAVLVVVAIFPVTKTLTSGDYGFNVNINDPSFKIVSVNNTTIEAVGVSNYTYNSTQIDLNLPLNWTGFSSNYLFKMTNTLNYGVSLNVSDNFTNGALFTYNVMNTGQEYYNGATHNATFAAIWVNNTTGAKSVKLVIAHNISSDGLFTRNYNPTRHNMTLQTISIVGDGLPVLNKTEIHIGVGQYLYMGIGNTNYFLPSHTGNATTSMLPMVNGTTHSKKYVSGSITI